jgi:hypothetical protein
MLCPDNDLCGVGRTDTLFANRPQPTSQMLGALIMAIGAGVTVVGSILLIWRNVDLREKEQIKSVHHLVKLALSGSGTKLDQSSETRIARNREHALNWSKATARVFKVFDLDNGGTIDY